MDIFNGEIRITARESALSGFAEVETITVEELYQAFVKREADDFQELLDEPESLPVWCASTYYEKGDKVLHHGVECKITKTGAHNEPWPPETFESELHALVTKYNLNHSDLTPEHIKQQVMKDNLADHNKAVKAKRIEKAYRSGYEGRPPGIFASSDRAEAFDRGRLDRAAEKLGRGDNNE